MRFKSAWVLGLIVYIMLALAACMDDEASPEPLTGDGGIDSSVADTGTTGLDTGTTSDTGFNFGALDAGTDAPPAPPDGGAPDGGDGGDSASPLDGAPPDGGATDSGPLADASGDASDSGPLDSGVDSGSPIIDAGVDTGPADAGLLKAGDNCSNRGCGALYRTGKLVADDGGFICDAPEIIGPLPLEICGNHTDDNGNCKADEGCYFCALPCAKDYHCSADAVCVADILPVAPPGACGQQGRCPAGKTCIDALGVCR